MLTVVLESLAKMLKLIYTLANFLRGNNVTSHVGKICLVLIITSVILGSACTSMAGSKGNNPVISSLEAKYTNVYPKGWTEIKCVASDSSGETPQFTWSADGGAITGEGSTVYWQGPNEYGDYHIMVTAKDSNGGNAEAVITLSVVPRPHGSCCR